MYRNTFSLLLISLMGAYNIALATYDDIDVGDYEKVYKSININSSSLIEIKSSTRYLENFFPSQNLILAYRLNPFRGQTLWYEGDKRLCISGYKSPFLINGDLEITFSHIVCPNEQEIVLSGLAKHDINVLGRDDGAYLICNKDNSILGIALNGGVFIGLDHFVEEFGVDMARQLLSEIEAVNSEN